MWYVDLQKLVNQGRAKLLSDLYKVKILLHNIYMSSFDEEEEVVEINVQTYGVGNNTLDVVYGQLLINNYVDITFQKEFIQPRVIKR